VAVRSAAARLLRSWVRIPPGARMFVCCECCVLSGRGLCDELITRPEESYRLWRVVVCDLETSRMRRPWPALGCSAIGGKKKHLLLFITAPFHTKVISLHWTRIKLHIFYRFGTSIVVCAYFAQIEAAEKWAWSVGLVATESALLNDGHITLRFLKAHFHWSLYTVEILQHTHEEHYAALQHTLCSVTWLKYSLSEGILTFWRRIFF